MDAPPALEQHHATTTAINDMLDEILFEIFHRLPLESYNTYRRACKRWRAFVSSPLFGSLYASHPIMVFKGKYEWYWNWEVSGKQDNSDYLELEQLPQRRLTFKKFSRFPLFGIYASCKDLLIGWRFFPARNRLSIFNLSTQQLIGFWGESLRVAAIDDSRGHDLRIWELKMKDYSNDKRVEVEWNLEHRVSLDHDLVYNYIIAPDYDFDPRPPRDGKGALCVVSFHPYDRDIVCLRWGRNRILLCNLRNKTLLPCFPLHAKAFMLHLPWWPTGPSQIPH